MMLMWQILVNFEFGGKSPASCGTSATVRQRRHRSLTRPPILICPPAPPPPFNTPPSQNAFPFPMISSNTDRPFHTRNHMSKILMFISTRRSLEWIATAAFKRFYGVACVYIFRLIVCPMSVNISFKMFALDKIHAAIMSLFVQNVMERNSLWPWFHWFIFSDWWIHIIW